MINERKTLDLAKRQVLYTMRSAGVGFRRIAEVIGCSPSTVLREERRNRAPKQVSKHLSVLERAKYADDVAKRRRREARRRRGRKLEKDAATRLFLLSLLESSHYSPETLADILLLSDYGTRASGKTIRRWIRRDYKNYQQHFPHRGRQRRKCLTPGGVGNQALSDKKLSIHERPEGVNARMRVGDFEIDMIVCSQSKVAILVVLERKTRYCRLARVENLEAQTIRQALIKILLEFPANLLNSCTYDRGKEFSQVQLLEKIFGLTNYFCDAYCSWQKGGVERQNSGFSASDRWLLATRAHS